MSENIAIVLLVRFESKPCIVHNFFFPNPSMPVQRSTKNQHLPRPEDGLSSLLTIKMKLPATGLVHIECRVPDTTKYFFFVANFTRVTI
jgi:hypothetical protein